MTAPDPAPLGVELRALIIKAFIGEAQAALADIEKQVKVAYPLPCTVQFESPLDAALLGRITRARTTPDWKVTAREQVVEHFTREFPGVLETVYLLAVPGIDTPVALPEDHPITQALLGAAPDLLTPERRVPDDVIEAAVQESRDTGQPAVPGINLVRGAQGNLSIVYDKKSAPAAIGRLIAAGHLTWAEVVGGSALALPAAVQREAS